MYSQHSLNISLSFATIRWNTRVHLQRHKTSLSKGSCQWKQFWHGLGSFHSFLSEFFLSSSSRRSLCNIPPSRRHRRHFGAQVSIPRAGQAWLWSVRHDHHGTFQQGRQVFLEIQDQASGHQAVLAQMRHLVLVLTFGMVVEALRAHHSHDTCHDQGPGILAQPPGPGAHVP